MPDPLEAILKYEMTQMEAKALKLALMWEKLTEKEFPDERQIVKLKKTGDPRKSLLFKYTYKLARETNGLIADSEYRLYIMAQLHVLKSITDGQVHALIDPQALCGPKAWNRWRMWKNKYDKRANEAKTERDLEVTATKTKVVAELTRTKQFLFEKFSGQPSIDQIKRTLQDRVMVKWITLGKVCPYYVLLSPVLIKALDGKKLDEFFVFDLTIYKPSITQEVREFFKLEFAHEFEA